MSVHQEQPRERRGAHPANPDKDTDLLEGCSSLVALLTGTPPLASSMSSWMAAAEAVTLGRLHAQQKPEHDSGGSF